MKKINKILNKKLVNKTLKLRYFFLMKSFISYNLDNSKFNHYNIKYDNLEFYNKHKKPYIILGFVYTNAFIYFEHYKLLNEMNENVAIYKFMDIADKKESYLKIMELGQKLMEKNINILPTVEEGVVVFRSNINYEPPVDIKI